MDRQQLKEKVKKVLVIGFVWLFTAAIVALLIMKIRYFIQVLNNN